MFCNRESETLFLQMKTREFFHFVIYTFNVTFCYFILWIIKRFSVSNCASIYCSFIWQKYNIDQPNVLMTNYVMIHFLENEINKMEAKSVLLNNAYPFCPTFVPKARFEILINRTCLVGSLPGQEFQGLKSHFIFHKKTLAKKKQTFTNRLKR